MKTKICTKCGKEKYDSWCKECRKEYDKQYYKKNKEKRNKQIKQYYKENKNKIKGYQKQWYEENKERLKKQHKQWYEENKEKMREYQKQWYEINKEHKKEMGKQWYKAEAKYDLYAEKMFFCEKIQRDPKNNILLQVKCTESNCKKWFNPTNREVQSRIISINGKGNGEHRFYCSDECKQSCSIYYQSKYPKGFRNTENGRQDQKEWADMVKERDNYTCVKCGRKDLPLVAHHFEGLNINPLMSADIDIGITLCKECDNIAHSEIGCRRVDLRRDSLCPQ